MKKVLVVGLIAMLFFLSSCSASNTTKATLSDGVSIGMTKADVISAEAKNGREISADYESGQLLDGVPFRDVPLHVQYYFEDDRLICAVYKFPSFADNDGNWINSTDAIYNFVDEPLKSLYGNPTLTFDVTLEKLEETNNENYYSAFGYPNKQDWSEEYKENPKCTYWDLPNITVEHDCSRGAIYVRVMARDNDYIKMLKTLSS